MKSILSRYLFLILMMCNSSIAAEAISQTLPKLSEPFPAADFSLQGEDGKTYRLSDYRGKVVILTFWATWCPPCRYEMPSLERLWHKVKNENVIIFGINVGENTDTIFEFTGNYPMSFPIPMDVSGKVVKQYPIRGLPTTYIINPNGMVTHRAVGSREWDTDEMVAAVKAGMATKP